MRSVKDNIINQIVFFLQGLNNEDPDKNDMMHTVITGPPGVGKTELGKILGKVYKAMGILSSDKMKIVSRSDLVGKYLGHTAKKTQEVIDECKGGIMFIDEAYSLGNKEGRDSFAKECIDTINQNLTERRDFLCIIAGYRDALDDCFFSYNEGLKRRFSFRYDIEAYDANELKHIFIS
jgi:SpoVK/Ycf46/Vps4 family AAA+-type ATPase